MTEKSLTVAASSNGFLLSPSSMDEALKLCNYLSKSSMIPQSFIGKPAEIFVVSAYGARLGMDPFASMQNIASVNGRPCIYGDGALAVVQRSGLCEKFSETIEGGGNQMVAICITKRKGNASEQTYRFSVHDAQTAGLWGKKGPWTQYPQRMLQMRARAFCLRSAYADVLSGLGVVEEMRDVFSSENPSAVRDSPAAKKPWEAYKMTREAFVSGIIEKLKNKDALDKAMPWFKSKGLSGEDLAYAEVQVKLALAQDVEPNKAIEVAEAPDHNPLAPLAINESVKEEETVQKATRVDEATGEINAQSSLDAASLNLEA